MTLPVSLDDRQPETAVYVSRKRGEVVAVFLPDLLVVEEGREGWFCLPDKFDIHEWEIMRRFADSSDSELAPSCKNAIHGRGAFRMFKDAVYRHGIQGEWFEFKRQSLRHIAAEALAGAGIPFR
jgi:hypothetical protein